MKAIVANVIFGGIFGCLSCANSTQANPVKAQSSETRQTVSTRTTSSSKAKAVSPKFEPQNNIFSVNAPHSFDPEANLWEYQQQFEYSISANLDPTQQINHSLRQQTSSATDCILSFCDRLAYSGDDRAKLTNNQLSSLAHQPYIHKSVGGELQLGFQPTFWSGESKERYWGVTTVEHWGDGYNVSSPQLDYINLAPTLGSGSSILTFSGGGNHNLAQPVVLDKNDNTTREFEDFRGGVTYHHGIFQQLTMGVGFVYEDNLAGFTQLTYNSDILPLKTTVSVLSKESTTEVRSHVRLQPAQNFVLNFHSDARQQKFNADWAIYPGFNFIAKANSRESNYSTGFKLAVQNNYFSLKASATLDSQQNLQWNLNSQIGGLQFSHSSDRLKSDSELSNSLFDSQSLGFQCSAFFKYQTQQNKNGQQEFTVWGGRIRSQTKVGKNKHQWSIDLGYGNSDRGKGLIANGSVALKPDLFLKLDYQEVSAVSDETNVKLQLSSN